MPSALSPGDSKFSAATISSDGAAGGGGGAVSSVFGRTGTVTAQAGDYSFSQISGMAAPGQLPLFTATLNGAVGASGGGTANFLRADGSWAAPAGGGGAVSSVFGRTGAVVASSGDYAFSQISGTVAPAQLPIFTTSQPGAVPAAGITTGTYLNQNGTFQTVSFSQLSGTITPAQMTLFTSSAAGAVPASGGGTINFLRADGTWMPCTVTSVFGRTGAITAQSGDYAFTQISGFVAASQLPLFTSSTAGAVSGSGGGTLNFLRADGNWAVPAGGGGGSLLVGTTTIGGGATGRVLYDNGGVLGEYTQAALTSYINLFTPSTPGTVPSSGGGTVNFLRADGTWAPPPGGSGGGTITIGSTAIVGGTSGRVLYDNAGLAGEYTQAQLTAQIAAFTSVTSGATPASGGGTTNFLRADGTWGVPPSAVTSVFGRTGAVVATTGDYSFSQISGTAAPTQLPLFTSVANGIVPASGGGTTNFLRADGTWAASAAPVTSVFGRTGAVVAAANDYSFSQISGSATLAQLPTIGANTVLGNNTGVSATPIALTQAQLTALINLFSSTLSGAVPASGGGTTNYLRADGTWTTVAPGSITAIASNTVLGNVTGGSAAPVALTATQLTTLVNVFTGALKGAVPAGTGGAGTFLTPSATWALPALKMAQRVFTTGTTYTPTAGTQFAIVECVGGGGAGGAVSGNATYRGGGGGGGSGGYSRSVLTAATIGASQTITIGAGGAAGPPAGSGGTTSFGALVTAIGGAAGGAWDGSTTWGAPGLGASPGTGQFAASGRNGEVATIFATVASGNPVWVTSGRGADSVFGTGGNAAQVLNAVGGNTDGALGSGGSSCAINNPGSTTAATAGGAGGAGICIVTEFGF